MSSLYCGYAFEELSENEMREIDGGIGLELTITSWSSVPCSLSGIISGTIVTIISLCAS